MITKRREGKEPVRFFEDFGVEIIFITGKAVPKKKMKQEEKLFSVKCKNFQISLRKKKALQEIKSSKKRSLHASEPGGEDSAKSRLKQVLCGDRRKTPAPHLDGKARSP